MQMSGRLNEIQVATAFSRQSRGFDDYDAGNTIIRYKRGRVREHVLRYLPATGSILELNAGTGTDALWFAGRGYRVHATDIASGMQERLQEKIALEGMGDRVTTELCSFTSLAGLKERGPYDLIFSNFAGLNCTGELGVVLRSLGPLLKPGGQLTMAILPPFCAWETLMLFKGKFKTAFRRPFSGKRGAPSQVEGVGFRCWYYSPSFVVRELGHAYELLGVEGLCTLVPPSYIEGFAEKHPGAYRFLRVQENKWKGKWPWRNIGDYYIISFRKR
ncbi:MAG TPA: class I SAM-dependent methyltransferase [Puia sp.]|nr:class I SAM-dependent methyltransferase [Puia sp.]